MPQEMNVYHNTDLKSILLWTNSHRHAGFSFYSQILSVPQMLQRGVFQVSAGETHQTQLQVHLSVSLVIQHLHLNPNPRSHPECRPTIFNIQDRNWQLV